MSSRRPDVLDILRRYAAGFFPLYDMAGQFYWERLSIRAIIPVNEQTARQADRMSRRFKNQFEMRYSTAIDAVITHLRDPAAGGIKTHSWVRGEVLGIYAALIEAGVLETIEAWAGDRLVGGLVGIPLPGTYIAETMFGLVPNASKACLCRLVQDCHAQGVEMIDVQTPHDLDEWGMRVCANGRTAHPCIRLGEKSVPLATFQRAFRAAWMRAFDGDVETWLASRPRRR